ncbi:MAG TPA: Mur ligase family protein [Gemmatimonadaceae bacterium]|nr:Mur ligase family protein [Gemmatimonadaceae bacterium]
MSRSLSHLARAIGAPLNGADVEVHGLAHDSRDVRRGDLFVAIPGAHVDGSRFIDEAVAAGAVAACATTPHATTPTIVSPDPRNALAGLAAAYYGNPANEMRLIAVTGSLGKTSTTLFVRTAMAGDGRDGTEAVGVIGTLGIRVGDRVVETGLTTPEAPAIHAALREMLTLGARTAVMEVTSHSLRLHRVEGLRFAIGVLTRIVPYEHLEFHPTPEHYIRTKMQLFDMIVPGGPLVVNLDDPIAREVTRGLDRPVIDLTTRGDTKADVAATLESVGMRGSQFTLEVRRALPRLDAGVVEPVSIPIRIPVLGVQQVLNAALGATVALLAGADPDTVAWRLARTAQFTRRMEVVRDRDPVIIDDAGSNPESIRALFDIVGRIDYARLRIVFAIRGSRGPAIVERNAEALAAALKAREPLLIVTASEGSVGPRDRVTDAERDATMAILRHAGCDPQFEPRLDTAIRRTFEGWAPGDLILMLGTQGMDGGAAIARHCLEKDGYREGGARGAEERRERRART